MKHKFPAPPDLSGSATGLSVPGRIRQFEVYACDGAGVFLNLEYEARADIPREKIALSLPAALKLAEELEGAVNQYLYETGEEIP